MAQAGGQFRLFHPNAAYGDALDGVALIDVGIRRCADEGLIGKQAEAGCAGGKNNREESG